MIKIPSTSNWKEIDSTTLITIQNSTSPQELNKEHWPAWAHGSTQFNRILAYALPIDHHIRNRLSSKEIKVLLTERIDIKDAPNIYNYNFYIVAELTNGKLYQSPPIKPTDPQHHLSKPSTWFDNLGPPKG